MFLINVKKRTKFGYMKLYDTDGGQISTAPSNVFPCEKRMLKIPA